MLVGEGCRAEGEKGEKKWDGCNSIINKIYFKKIKIVKETTAIKIPTNNYICRNNLITKVMLTVINAQMSFVYKNRWFFFLCSQSIACLYFPRFLYFGTQVEGASAMKNMLAYGKRKD